MLVQTLFPHVKRSIRANGAKNLFSQLNEFLNNFIIGKNSQAGVNENKAEDPQNGLDDNFGSAICGENRVSCSQVIGRNIVDRVAKEVDCVVAAVEN